MNIARLIRLIEKATDSPRPQTKLKSTKTSSFDKCYDALPANIKAQARETFIKWMANPASTDFRGLVSNPDIWRISIGLRYRALAQKVAPSVYRWYWIGSHEEYNKKYKRA